MSSCTLLPRPEKRSDQVGRVVPLTRFARELFSSGGGERVVLGAPIVLGLPPLGFHASFLCQLEQCWVQCSVVQRETIAARLLDASRDAVAVQRAECVEGA